MNALTFRSACFIPAPARFLPPAALFTPETRGANGSVCAADACQSEWRVLQQRRQPLLRRFSAQTWQTANRFLGGLLIGAAV